MARSGSLGCALGRDCNAVVDCQGSNAGSLTRMLMSFIVYRRSKPVISVVAHEWINRELRESWRPRSPSSNAGLGSWRIVRAPNKRYEVPGLLNLKTHDLSLTTASVCRSRCESQRLHDGVVQIPPHLLNLLILSRRMHAICEEDHKQLPVGIDPHRSPGESRVSETMF